MTIMTTERRRNMKTENCRACGKVCGVGQGYLYRDTHGRPNRYTGRFGWFVKCEECHGENQTRMTVAIAKRAAAHADEPVVRPWSVSQVKGWAIIRTVHEGDVAIRIEGRTFSRIVSYRDPINSRFTAPTGYAMEQMEFGGKPLSESAASHLSDRVFAIVVAVQNEEQVAGEAAITKLVAAGATAVLCRSGFGWKVEYKSGRYTLWGCVGGGNKVSGLTQPDEQGRWIETTVEELLGGE